MSLRGLEEEFVRSECVELLVSATKFTARKVIRILTSLMRRRTAHRRRGLPAFLQGVRRRDVDYEAEDVVISLVLQSNVVAS